MKTEHIISAILYVMAIASALLFGGCGANVLEVANSARVASLSETAIRANPKAEAILSEAFTKATWDDQQLAEATTAREAIKSQLAFLKKKQEIDGTVPYYTYKTSLEVIGYNYGILKDILDERVGTLGEPEGVIYDYVVRDIAIKLEVQRVKAAEVEADINNRADALSAEQIRNIYDTLKPLVEIVL